MLRFDFHGVHVEVQSESDELLRTLVSDFRYFHRESDPTASPPQLRVHATVGPIPNELIPLDDASRQSFNCLSYDQGEVLTNDYYGEVLSILNRRTEEAKLFGPDLHRLHEVTFLLILSRVGKILDMRGLHKIHAFGVELDGKFLIGSMPMRGGKSTLLQCLLENPKTAILSDDTPLVDRSGRLYPFPLRIGTDRPNPKLQIKPEFLSQFERKQWGTKTLIDLAGLPNPVSKGGTGPIILFRGVRSRRPGCKIQRISRLRIFRELLSTLVIGIGLPMILEYFLERGFSDWPKRLYILVSRTRAALALALHSEAYRVSLGPDSDLNARALEKLVLSRK